VAFDRVSVSAVSSWRQPFADDVAMWDRLGVGRVGLSLRKCEEAGWGAAVGALAAHDLTVTNVVECGWLDPFDPHTWRPANARWSAAIDALHAFAPWVLVLTTGPSAGVEWDRAVARLADAWAPTIATARAAGVTVAVENTGSLRADLSFVFSLRDACDLATTLDIAACMEINSCWAERGVVATMTRESSRIAHAQFSDWLIGSACTPDRRVPGDGDIPLVPLVRALESAGYHGAYELELVGPAIENEGYESAIGRPLQWLREALPELQ
jgi:sugar phosphate isomerase/epimerase